MEYNYNTLVTLRNNTTLGPISYLKVIRERERILELESTIYKAERYEAGIYFSSADKLEIDLRFMAWKRKIFYFWYDNYSDMDFEQFAIDLLNQVEEGKKKHVLKKL